MKSFTEYLAEEAVKEPQIKKGSILVRAASGMGGMYYDFFEVMNRTASVLKLKQLENKNGIANAGHFKNNGEQFSFRIGRSCMAPGYGYAEHKTGSKEMFGYWTEYDPKKAQKHEYAPSEYDSRQD